MRPGWGTPPALQTAHAVAKKVEDIQTQQAGPGKWADAGISRTCTPPLCGAFVTSLLCTPSSCPKRRTSTMFDPPVLATDVTGAVD